MWYGYHEAVKKLPKSKELSFYDKLQMGKPNRADLWASFPRTLSPPHNTLSPVPDERRSDTQAHTRSHPSQFLTTRTAPPRLFPFPLGKTRPDASVKDELWWEGGHAPHVGHFNHPKLPYPNDWNEDVLLNRAKLSIARDTQLALCVGSSVRCSLTARWRKRLRHVQTLCIIIIVYFGEGPGAGVALRDE